MANAEKVKRAHALLGEPILSFEDRMRLAKLLAPLLDDAKITAHNIFESGADVRFMAKYYPYEDYRRDPISETKAGHTIASLCKGDVKSVFLEVLSHVKTTRGSGPSPDQKKATRERIRVLALKTRTPDEDSELLRLLQRHSLKTKVDESNRDAVAKRFLEIYFPADSGTAPG
ncbi:MAG: hypothetical protein KGL39_26800 [Patescibacteria group bacterium]|nr:hypothetical protein [Patescibacteria group bacterium]